MAHREAGLAERNDRQLTGCAAGAHFRPRHYRSGHRYHVSVPDSLRAESPAYSAISTVPAATRGKPLKSRLAVHGATGICKPAAIQSLVYRAFAFSVGTAKYSGHRTR